MNLIWISGFDKSRGILVKTVRVGCVQIKNKISKEKCKIESFEVSGHWFRVLRQPTCPRVFFPRVGEDDI